MKVILTWRYRARFCAYYVRQAKFYFVITAKQCGDHPLISGHIIDSITKIFSGTALAPFDARLEPLTQP